MTKDENNFNDVQNENNDEPVIIDGILLKSDDDMKDVVVEPYEEEIRKKRTIETPAGRIYTLIGIITIVFGIVVFVYMLTDFSSFMQNFPLGSGLSFRLLVFSFGISLLFIVPGTICVGIGTIITQLDKNNNN